MKRRWKRKHIIVGLGIVVAVFGWFTGKITPKLKLSHIIAPGYFCATKAYEKLIRNNILERDTEGFPEICTLIFYVEPNLHPDQIQKCQLAGRTGFTITMGSTSSTLGPTTDIVVYLVGGEKERVQIRDPQSLIRQVFFERRLMTLGNVIFWLGIGVAIIGLTLEIYEPSNEFSKYE